MASTNKTTHYELSQYIGSDKPTYMVDYNADMLAIDTGIYNAKSEADTNATSIGTLSNLNTTAKNDLVSAINENQGNITTNTNNIGTNTSNIATNATNIGTLANLTTTSKTDLVVATNEVNAKIGTLSNLETDVKSTIVNAINEVVEKFNFNDITNYNNDENPYISDNGSVSNGRITVATNSDGSIGKIYGFVIAQPSQNQESNIKIGNTSLRPDSQMIITYAGISIENSNLFTCDLKIETNGDVYLVIPAHGTNSQFFIFQPYLYIIKNFGDTSVI